MDRSIRRLWRRRHDNRWLLLCSHVLRLLVCMLRVASRYWRHSGIQRRWRGVTLDWLISRLWRRRRHDSWWLLLCSHVPRLLVCIELRRRGREKGILYSGVVQLLADLFSGDKVASGDCASNSPVRKERRSHHQVLIPETNTLTT